MRIRGWSKFYKNKMKNYLALINSAEIQNDWEGKFSLLGTDLAIDCYFSSLEKFFGLKFPFVLLLIEDGISSMYLPTESYQKIGKKLVEISRDKEFFEKWMKDFIEASDRVIEIAKNFEPDKFLLDLENIKKAYSDYAGYQVATKIAFNFLSRDVDAEAMDMMEKARKYSEDFFKVSEKKLNEVANELRNKLEEYSLDQIKSLTSKEIVEYFKNGKIVSALELEDRSKNGGIIWDGDKNHLLTKDEIQQIKNHHLSGSEKNEIVGNVAYKGVVRGVCRIIKNYENANLQEGEVLVTGMTDPHFVPLMKKASSIITDGGGLLCHAAIVARELKKPCIIGTKIATQALKDGDLVEVDADRGIVRIIKRV